MHLRNTGLIALAVSEVLVGVLIVHWLLQDFLLLSLIGPCLTAIGLHALGQAQHESFHRLLFPGKALNDAVGKILCSWVLASAFAGLRQLHFRHHGKFASDEDPDSWHWAGAKDGRSATCLALKVLCFQRIWSRTKLIRSASRMSARDGERFQIACLQLVICLMFLRFSSVATFVLAWLVPLFSLMPFIEHIRVVAEHHNSKLRIFPNANSLECWIFGRFGFQLHAYHHLNSRVPWHALTDRTIREQEHDVEVQVTNSWIREFARVLVQ